MLGADSRASRRPYPSAAAAASNKQPVQLQLAKLRVKMVRAIGTVLSLPHPSSSLILRDKVSLWCPIGYRSSRNTRKAAVSCSSAQAPSSAASAQNKKEKEKSKVKMISSKAEFDTMLRDAKNKLVVVEYAASHSVNSKRIYPAMVELSRSCPETVFGLILADESEETKDMFNQAGVEQVPHFIFYKSMEVVHEEEAITHAITQDTLLGDVLYYGDAGSSSAGVEQLHSRADVEASMEKHKQDGQLLVLDVGLKQCGPCVKVYPTVLKLARKLAGTVVFARMHGDENDDCMELLKELGVIEVPTFLFIKDGVVQGRYVGSGRGELIGEILRHQGVRVT